MRAAGITNLCAMHCSLKSSAKTNQRRPQYAPIMDRDWQELLNQRVRELEAGAINDRRLADQARIPLS